MLAPEDRAIVVKVGGSLLGWADLRSRLAQFMDSDGVRDSRLVLIAGGGPVADIVRDLDATHGLGAETGHRLAIRAMDLTAFALASLVDGSTVVEVLDELPGAWARGLRPILAPRRFLEQIDEPAPDPLPLSWSTTSDSIAARVAVHMGKCRLILLKSEPTGATTRVEAAALGHVDPVFPRACGGLMSVESVDLRDPTRRTVSLDP